MIATPFLFRDEKRRAFSSLIPYRKRPYVFVAAGSHAHSWAVEEAALRLTGQPVPSILEE